MTDDGLFTNSFSPTLQRHIRYNIDSLTSDEPLARQHNYPGGDAGRIQVLFTELLSADHTLGLVHGDLSAKNTILGNDGTVYLIDYGCAFCGVVPYDEIICVNEHTPRELSVFLQSYGFDHGEPRNTRRLSILTLPPHLIHF